MRRELLFVDIIKDTVLDVLAFVLVKTALHALDGIEKVKRAH